MNEAVIKRLQKNDTIQAIGYANDFIVIKHKNTIGYVNSIHLENYPTISYQIQKFRDLKDLNDKKQQAELLTKLENQKLKYSFLEDDIEFKPQDYTKEIEKFRQLKSPIAIVEPKVNFNSIGNPEAFMKFINISNKVIDAITIDIYCYNNFNNPVNHYLHKTNLFRGIAQEEFSQNEESFGIWTLYGYDNTTKFKAIIRQIHFKDNTKWINNKNDAISIKSF